MTKTTMECSPSNCSDLFDRCGKYSTYCRYACRCDSCRAAAAEYAKTRRASHPERAKAVDKKSKDKNREGSNRRRREAYAANADRLKAEWRQKYATNPAFRAKVSENGRVRRAAHPDYAKSKSREFREANPDYASQACRAWREANREASRESVRRWTKANQHRVREYSSAYRARKLAATVIPFTADQWEQKKAYWGNRCYLQIPGLCNGGAETMDHVKPLATESTSAHMLANLRPACRRCNSSKGNTWPYPVSANASEADAWIAGVSA